MDRRSFLQLLGGTVALSLAPRIARAEAKAKSVVLLYMEGGASQLDTFDPKPGHANGGPFQAIETLASGLRISEFLPRIAAQGKHLAVVRTLTAKEGNHDRARRLMHTGHVPQAGADFPGFGSVVAQARGARVLPGVVAVNGPGEGAGYLGAKWGPLPVRDPAKAAEFLEPAKNVGPARVEARRSLRAMLDGRFGDSHPGPLAEGRRDVMAQAVALSQSPELAAFHLDAEPAPFRDHYGEGAFAQGCLLARRLVEAGVPFVEVVQKGWDTHEDNFERVKKLSDELDRGMAALLEDLAARGLLASTLVVWMGDFGRTPRINAKAGRDHFPSISNAVLAGGGVKGGLAVGATNEAGTIITERPVTVPDLFRTIAQLAGIDADASRETGAGRPVRIVDGGEVIHEIV